ncbi:transposase [Desulfobulbus rhabdoformis]|nr:transposase [Desulfobulbus rhabdoformis]
MVLGNIKNALRGTYHPLSDRHLPRYLAEFCYRFNRRFRLAAMVEQLASVALPPLRFLSACLSRLRLDGNQIKF